MNTCDNCELQLPCFASDINCVNVECNLKFTHHFCSNSCAKDFDMFYSDSVTCANHQDEACL